MPSHYLNQCWPNQQSYMQHLLEMSQFNSPLTVKLLFCSLHSPWYYLINLPKNGNMSAEVSKTYWWCDSCGIYPGIIDDYYKLSCNKSDCEIKFLCKIRMDITFWFAYYGLIILLYAGCVNKKSGTYVHKIGTVHKWNPDQPLCIFCLCNLITFVIWQANYQIEVLFHKAVLSSLYKLKSM